MSNTDQADQPSKLCNLRPRSVQSLGAGLCLLVALVSSGLASDPTELQSIEASELVRRLGSASFDEREQVAAELLRRGTKAEPALVAALKITDLEVRLRVQHLLVAISQSDLDRRLAAFVADDSVESNHELPGWRIYRNVVGNNLPARQLFAEMVRAESELLGALDQPSPSSGQFLARRLQSLQTDYRTGLTPTVSQGSLAALLFSASQLESGVNSAVGMPLFNLLNRPATMQLVSDGDQSTPWRKLLGAWLEVCTRNSSLATSGLSLALRHNLSDIGLDLGRKIVAKYDQVGTATLPYALLAIGRFGAADDVALLEPLLENASVCHSWHVNQTGKTIQIQIRDVALVSLIHMTRQNHREYGFALLQPSETTLFQIFTCGFDSPEQRQAALDKWRAWSEKGKEPSAKDPPLPNLRKDA